MALKERGVGADMGVWDISVGDVLAHPLTHAALGGARAQQHGGRVVWRAGAVPAADAQVGWGGVRHVVPNVVVPNAFL